MTFRHRSLTADIQFHLHCSSFKISDSVEAPFSPTNLGLPVTHNSIMAPEHVHHQGLQASQPFEYEAQTALFKDPVRTEQ